MDQSTETNDTVAIEVAPETTESTHRSPRFGVMVFNDDYHTFEYVIVTLMDVLKKSFPICSEYATRIHEQGKALVFTGHQELAELKCEQIIKAGPDCYASTPVEFPLDAKVVELEA